MSFKEDTQTLLDLGLTTSQAKVYLALLKLATDSKGTTIAHFAGVHRQDVYRLLAELQQIGIITKTLARPATFKSASPNQAINILLKRKIGDMSRLKEAANDFAQRASKIFREQTPESGNDEFLLISDRESITCKAREAIEHTEKHLEDITPLNELGPWLDIFSDSIDKALARGAKIRWITEKPVTNNWLTDTLEAYLKKANFKVRFLKNLPEAKLGVFDRREVILGIFPSSDLGRSPALWSNNASLIAITSNFFESCWSNSTDSNPKRGALTTEQSVN